MCYSVCIMRRLVIQLCAIAGALATSAGERPDLVAQVRAGTCTEARASWWGFDPADSTAQLQAALTSGVARLVVDKMSSPWVVTISMIYDILFCLLWLG